jgi:hypothetical protein
MGREADLRCALHRGLVRPLLPFAAPYTKDRNGPEVDRIRSQPNGKFVPRSGLLRWWRRASGLISIGQQQGLLLSVERF